MELTNNRIKEILDYNNHLKENDRLSIEDTHEKLRSILIDYGCAEYGDAIVDEISSLFNFPTTIDVEPEEPTNVQFYLATYDANESDEQPFKEVLAVFVDEFEAVVNGVLNEKGYTCYAHLGQHSTCSESFLVENCRKITDQEDYVELYNELLNLGYNLNIV